MIHVIAVITTVPGKREEVLKEFKQLMPLVHAEKGCIEYQPIVDINSGAAYQTDIGPDSYIVVEKWDTLEDLDAHSKADHMKEYGAKMGSLIADRRIHILTNA